MALSIKDSHTDQMARELSLITGESLTEAISRALEERLNKLKSDRDFQKRKTEIHKITARFRDGFKGAIVSDEELYDDNGLPK